MPVDEKAIGLGAMLVGWLGAMFMYGRKAGHYEARFKDIKETVESHTTELTALKNHHDEDMRQIRAFFSTDAGGQKFVTFPDLDTLYDRNSKAIIIAITNQTDAIKRNTEVVEAMGEKIHILNVDVAVLKERRINGQRQGNGVE